MFYSKTTGGFYDLNVHGNRIPADAVEISKERYIELLNQQSSGKVIVGDANGYPIAVEPTPAPATWDTIREQRNFLLYESDWTQLSDSPADKASWAVYRQELRDITSTFATPEAVVWPTKPE